MRRKRPHSRGSSVTDVRRVSSTQLEIVQLEHELALRERQPERAHASKVRRNNETARRAFSTPKSRDAAHGHDTPPPHDSASTSNEDHDYYLPPANDEVPSTSKDMNVNARSQPATRRSAPVKMLHGKRSSVQRSGNNTIIAIPVDDLLRHGVQICHGSSKKVCYHAPRSPSGNTARNKTQNRSSHQKKYSKKVTRKYTKTRSRDDSSSSRSRTRERYPSRSHKSRSHKSRSRKSRRSRKLSRSPNSSRSRSSTSSSSSSRSGHSSRSSVSTRHNSRKKKRYSKKYRVSPCSRHEECSCRLSPSPASSGHKNYHTQNRRSPDNARAGNKSHSNSSMQHERQEDTYHLRSPLQSPLATKCGQAHSENKKITSRNQEEVPDPHERRHRKSADRNSNDHHEKRRRKSADRNSNDPPVRKRRKSADHNSNDTSERRHRKSADRNSDTGSVRSSSRTSNKNFLQRLGWKSSKQETGHSSRQKESSKDFKPVKEHSQTKQQKTDEVTRQRHRRHDSPEPRSKNKENLSCTLM